MSSFTLRHLSGVAGAVLVSAPALAQVSPSAQTRATQLDPITVTAARAPQPLSAALGDVTVIDADTIARAGQSSLADLLQREHGIDVATNGGPQTVTSVFIRGANSAQTVFLIDGARVGSSTAGGAGINAIPLSQIERIEILRGPASSLYGADAIGGVINIITRRGSPGTALALTGSVGYGSWNTQKADIGLSGSQGMWNYALSLGHARSDGYSAAKPGEPGGLYNSDRDGYKLDTASGRLGMMWAEGQELQASFFQSRLNGQYDGGAGFDQRAIQKIESLGLASNNRINSLWTSRLRAVKTVDDNVSLSEPFPAFGVTGRAQFRTRQTQFSWQNDLAIAPGQVLSLAAERREEDVDSDTRFNATSRNTNSALAIYRADLGRNHVQANLRYDRVSSYGNRTTGGLSYGFDLTPAWQLTAAANTGFRLPTFNDLYYPGFSNPNLQPEKSKNYEAGVRYRQGGTTGSLIAYHNKVDNLIQYQGRTTVVNKDATLKGITLTAAQQFGATSVRGSIDIVDPKDNNTGEQLTRRARQVLKLAGDHQLGAWRVGAEWVLSGKRSDTSYNASIGQFGANETTRLGGYSLLNLTASYDITRQAQVQVRWNNVMDKDYELARGYATPGSNVFVNLVYRP